MALPAGGTLRFVGQRRTALPGTPGPCAEFQNGLRKFFDAHRAPAAPRACDASEPSWAASEAHLRCTRKSTYENQRRCVRVVKSAASDAGDLGSSPGEVTFCDKLACARLRRVLVALPLETSRPPSSRTAKHRMPHPGKPRRHGRGPARSLGRSPMHPKGVRRSAETLLPHAMRHDAHGAPSVRRQRRGEEGTGQRTQCKLSNPLRVGALGEVSDTSRKNPRAAWCPPQGPGPRRRTLGTSAGGRLRRFPVTCST